MFNDIQRAINVQEELLKSVGGAIYSKKSFAYSIAFSFKAPNKYIFQLVEQIDRTLLVKKQTWQKRESSIIQGRQREENYQSTTSI